MPLRKLALGAVLLGAVSLSSFALGQQNAQPDAAQQFSYLYDHAQTDPDQLDPLFDAYAKLPGDATVTKKAVRLGWIDAKKGDSNTFLVIQAMQNQRMIEQNQKLVGQNARIIELLEKSAKK